jgi:transcription initiation factor TFIID subunit TAF12
MEPEQASQQQAGDNANDLQEKKARRKRSRWGAETEAGLQVLAVAEVEQLQQQQPVAEQQHTQQQQQQQPGSGDGTDAARKKRRSRWEPETEAKPGIIQGLQIALPPAIAALVDAHVDPKTMELQRQLNIVSLLC